MLNKIFKVIFSRVSQNFIVVSELARGGGK
ncbi:ESPR domain-containing protein [Gallibacterium salpingitidis]